MRNKAACLRLRPIHQHRPLDVEIVVENGFGLTITCACGNEAKWTCRETFLRANGAVEVDLRTFATRLKRVCGDPRLTVGWWRDIRAVGGVKPSSTYAARVAEWSKALEKTLAEAT